MRIDVVVPAYNASSYIRACLISLLQAGFTPDDITVVDDGSTDDTVARCKELGVMPVELGENSSAAVARNTGARRGTADLVLFVDADIMVHANTRRVLEDFFSDNPDYAAVFGTYDDRPQAPGRVSRIRNLLHRHVHLVNAGPAITFWSGCGAVRRPAFEKVGGYDESREMMEDVDLGMRLSRCSELIMLEPRLQGKHLKRWTLASMARTDLLQRAIPWARLLAQPEVKDLPDTLNISNSGRISVISVAASLAGAAVAILISPWVGLATIAVSLITLTVTNSDFLGSLWSEHSKLDALVAIPVLWVHFACGGLGFGWVKVTLLLGLNKHSARPVGDMD